MTTKTTVVLFQTHFFDRWAEAAFRRLRAGAPRHYEFVVLIHLPADAPLPDRLRGVPHHVVRTPEIREQPYPGKVGGARWDLWYDGHTDLILMHYWRAHPDFERYWAIEYDVGYSSPWRNFFAVFEDDESDLLAPLLCRQRDFPEWKFWASLATPGTTPSHTQAVSSFMPIFRASGRLMRAMDEAYRAGWTGHLECTYATIAELRGMRVTDFGGYGEFTPERYRGRFYSGNVHDELRGPGTMVFRPIYYRTGSRPNMLWHPIKPFWFRIEMRRELLVMRAAIARQIRSRGAWLLPPRWREPGSFSRPSGTSRQ